MDNKKEQKRIDSLPFKLHKNLRAILDAFKDAIHNKNFSQVIVIDGKSGKGKTTLSFQIASYCDPNFNLDKVFYTPEEFIDGLSIAKKGDCLVFDEAMLISNRSAMSSINRMVVIAMSMIRSKNLTIIFNVNSIFDLDRNLSLFRADLLLHVYSEGLTDRGKFMAFYKAMDGLDRIKALYILGKKYYDYSKPKCNFYTTFSSNFVLNERDYEERKQKGINAFLKNSSGSSRSIAHERDLLISWVKKNTELSVQDISEISGLSERTIYRVLSRRTP